MRTSETYEQSYPGNASTVTAYPITFQFIDAADLELIATDVDGLQEILDQGVDYTVTRDSVTELGSFVTAVAHPATSTLKIYRQNILTQNLDYVNSDTFPADSHEQAMDRMMEGLQSVRAMAARALRVSPADMELEGGEGGSPPNTVAGLGSAGEFLWRTAEELTSFLSLPAPILNMPTKTWANSSERALAVPDYLGQVGTQRDTSATYVSTGLSAGNWTLTLAGGVPDLSITREKLADGLLTADSLGRAKMVDAYITLAKVNLDFITGMTAKTLLEDADKVAGWSSADNAFRSFAGPAIHPPGSIIQTESATYTANTNITTIIPADDTIPQITEGTEIISLAITPRFASSRILLTFNCQASASTALSIGSALFRSPVTNALCSRDIVVASAGWPGEMNMIFVDSPATTSAITYTARVGPGTAGTIRLNGRDVGRIHGGAQAATLLAQEIKV